MTAAASCGCHPLAADSLSALAWEEAADTYGFDSAEPAADSRWLRNAVSLNYVVFSCGRLSSGTDNHPPHEPGEAERCVELAQRCAAALSGVYVQRGDESDHRFEPFSAPAAAGAPWARVDEGALSAACGGALCPQLRFEATPLADYLDGCEEDVEAYRSLAALFEAEGCRQATSFRPLELREGNLRLTCVYPHFIVALTPGGSLVGVFGLTVWT
jgi:hypothetical protein